LLWNSNFILQPPSKVLNFIESAGGHFFFFFVAFDSELNSSITLSTRKTRRSDIFLRDFAVINDFPYYMEAEPFITDEKTENQKRLTFKKVKAE